MTVPGIYAQVLREGEWERLALATLSEGSRRCVENVLAALSRTRIRTEEERRQAVESVLAYARALGARRNPRGSWRRRRRRPSNWLAG